MTIWSRWPSEPPTPPWCRDLGDTKWEWCRDGLWPEVNKAPTQLWTGYFLTWPEKIFWRDRIKIWKNSFFEENFCDPDQLDPTWTTKILLDPSRVKKFGPNPSPESRWKSYLDKDWCEPNIFDWLRDVDIYNVLKSKWQLHFKSCTKALFLLFKL